MVRQDAPYAKRFTGRMVRQDAPYGVERRIGRVPHYVRWRDPGAAYFFTVVTHERRPFLTSELARAALRTAWRETGARYPFVLEAVCLLPDHLHCIWRMPEDDDDYSTRWRFLKQRFTTLYLQGGGAEGAVSESRKKRQERGVWQRRFWEHRLRDDKDYARHFDYVHFNPVKHELTGRPEDWPWSTFQRYAARGWYEVGWGIDAVPASLRDFNAKRCE